MEGSRNAAVPRDVPVIFAQGRGARLAYQVFGSGPATVVAIPPTAQNIEIAADAELHGSSRSGSRTKRTDP